MTNKLLLSIILLFWFAFWGLASTGQGRNGKFIMGLIAGFLAGMLVALSL